MSASDVSPTSVTVRRSFLFTDMESSTRLWDQYPDTVLAALDLHDRLLSEAVTSAGGLVYRHTGDGIIGVFRSAGEAVLAALAGQRAIAGAMWQGVEPLKVRMGVHTGDVVIRDAEHHGWALNFASRLHSLAHGGQVVVSGSAMAEIGPGDFAGAEFVDLGLHRLRDVAEPVRVYTVVADGLERFDRLRSAAGVVEGLPRPLTSFVGREDDVGRLLGALDAHRVVTVTGIAGLGKTRLAIEASARDADRFVDGVVMCELANVAAQHVGAAVAKSLGVERRTLRSAEESVVEWMTDKRMLLLLDTCEEAPEAVGALVHQISRVAPHSRVLATSHQPLEVEGEHVLRLLPLPVDDGGSESVELFLQRAVAAGADLTALERARPLAEAVCRAVDGLPLAIEIAASNAGSLSLGDILDAVRTGELPSVAGSGRQQRSVVDALDLSLGRLDPIVRSALVRCSVFAGSFDRAAFSAIAAPRLDRTEALAVLRTLVDRSLITSETRRDRTRFRLLEPVRVHAQAKCAPDELAEARAAFVRFYVHAAEASTERLRGTEEAQSVSQVELDFDNLRAAQLRALEVDGAEGAMRIVASLWDFAFMRMRSEIFDWGEAAAAAGVGHPLRPMVLGVVALGGWLRENPAKATACAQESMRLERETGAEWSVPARMALMNSAQYGGAAVDVRSLMAELADPARVGESAYWQVNIDVLRVLSHSYAGRPDKASEVADLAMRTARRSQNPSTMAWALFAKGIAVEPNDADHAEALFEDALGRARSVENGWVGAMCATRLASLRRRRGAWADSMSMVVELLDVWERAGHRSHLWGAVGQAALCLAVSGDAPHAVMLHEAALSPLLRVPALPAEARADAECLERVRTSMSEADRRWWRLRGADLDLVEAVRLARDRIGAALIR